MQPEGSRPELALCRFPGGWEGHCRHSTVGGIIENESRTHTLLVKRSDQEPVEPGRWVLPGGYVDPDATVTEAMQTEGREEAGQHLTRLALFGIADRPERERLQNITFVFAAQVPDSPTYGEVSVVDPDEGTQAARWFTWEERPTGDEVGFDHDRILRLYEQDRRTFPLSIFLDTRE
jgi:ADP-ribose pyrophosphatase YjhB (NUDIX family)